jgi:hypothetical protein
MNTTITRSTITAARMLILAASFIGTHAASGQITPPPPSPQPPTPVTTQVSSGTSMLVPESVYVNPNPHLPHDPSNPPAVIPGFRLVDGCILVPDTGYGDRSYEPGSAWPSGYIPFEFASDVSQTNRQHMKNAMWIVSQTAADINFVERANGQVPYVYITNNAPAGSAGVSYGIGVSSWNGANEIAMAADYWDDTFIAVHELMHRLGFHHEQSRPDRDQHVRIEWGNISSGYASQFTLYSSDNTLGTPYDYTSIMHYGACGFSSCSSCSSSDSGCRTITTLNAGYQSVIGNRSSWGAHDQADLQAVYGSGSCAYAKAGSTGVAASLGAPTADLNLAASIANGGTVWCNRGSTPFTAPVLSSPATYKAHGNGGAVTFGQ